MRYLLAGLVLCFSSVVWAEAVEVPKALDDWRGWVLQGHGDLRCPFLPGSAERVCVWPSELRLDATANGVGFAQKIEVYTASWVRLPGDHNNWPQGVTAGGKPLALRAGDGLPEAWLEPGTYDIRGQIRWAQMPRSLHIPGNTGIIALTLNGKAVAAPMLEGSDQVWLAANNPEAKTAATDEVNLRVFRHLADGIPLRVTTRLELQVSGKERELVLGQFLLDGLSPTHFNSALPARIEADGKLRLQVKPGTWVVELQAQTLTPKPLLQYAASTEFWPNQEVWVFQGNPQLRSVQIAGATSIDPAQTQLPAQWQQLPAYLVAPQQPFELVELARGNADAAKNKLFLSRTLWLDFSGEGFSFEDRLNGEVIESCRLDVAAPFTLGRVMLNREPQLITQLDKTQAQGVEVRQAQLDLMATGRLPRELVLPIGGWLTSLNSVETQLMLPPGWSLFFASGVERVSNAWLSNWHLWDVFLVLVLVLGITKITQLRVGALALLGLLCFYQRPGAPVLIWLNLVLILALLPLVAGGFRLWLQRYRLFVFAWLMLSLLPFTVTQVRLAFYPQLDSSGDSTYPSNGFLSEFGRRVLGTGMQGQYMGDSRNVQVDIVSVTASDDREIDDAGPPPPANFAPAPGAKRAMAVHEQTEAKTSQNAPMAAAAGAPSAEGYTGQSGESRGSGFGPTTSLASQYDPNQQVQTGSAVPEWKFHLVRLAWSGPITAAETTRLMLVPPSLNALGNLMAAFLPWLLAAALWRSPRSTAAPKVPQGPALSSLALLLAGVLAGAGCLLPADSQAEVVVDKALLKDLETRLTQAPSCGENCVSLEAVNLKLAGDSLSLDLGVDAQTLVSLPLPANRRSWWPSLVVVDGQAATLSSDANGTLLVSLPPGRHLVHLQGYLTGVNSLPLEFGMSLHNLQTDLQGWSLSGGPEYNRPSQALQLQRSETAAASEASRLAPAPIAPFVRVWRQLKLGLDWTVETQVERIAPATGVINLEIPLLPGEAPLSLQTNSNGRMTVNLAADSQVFSWSSRLKHSDKIALVAPTNVPWVELWNLDSAPIWHTQLSGIAPQQITTVAYQPQWQPWPGESVTIEVTRPSAVPGNHLTIQSASLTLLPGQKLVNQTLTLKLLSNRGGSYDFTLPAASRLTQVRIDGLQVTVNAQDGVLKIPLKPGEQTVDIDWESNTGIGLKTTTPNFDFGTPASNLRLQMHMPEDRWLLALGGPALGPALLFWGMLGVVLALAVALARSGKTPLKTYEWVLLSLGVCTVNLFILALMAGWFVALHLRGRTNPLPHGRRFKALQASLFTLSVVALGSLLLSIPSGLLSAPNMHIVGIESANFGDSLTWYHDQTTGPMPSAWVISLPMWCYRAAILVWALWLALALLRWVTWAWVQLGVGGYWYRPMPAKPEDKTEMTAP